jgi:hypothetical protein
MRCPVTDKKCYNEYEGKEVLEYEQSISPAYKLRLYRCEFCDFWHLTHKKNKMTL